MGNYLLQDIYSFYFPSWAPLLYDNTEGIPCSLKPAWLHSHSEQCDQVAILTHVMSAGGRVKS